jgi:hypothetical protein
MTQINAECGPPVPWCGTLGPMAGGETPPGQLPRRQRSVALRALAFRRCTRRNGLLPAGGGPACWSERAEGSSENYGYAGSIENYQETLNQALDRAAMRALSSPGFRKAVCSCAGN